MLEKWQSQSKLNKNNEQRITEIKKEPRSEERMSLLNKDKESIITECVSRTIKLLDKTNPKPEKINPGWLFCNNQPIYSSLVFSLPKNEKKMPEWKTFVTQLPKEWQEKWHQRNIKEQGERGLSFENCLSRINILLLKIKPEQFGPKWIKNNDRAIYSRLTNSLLEKKESIVNWQPLVEKLPKEWQEKWHQFKNDKKMSLEESIFKTIDLLNTTEPKPKIISPSWLDYNANPIYSKLKNSLPRNEKNEINWQLLVEKLPKEWQEKWTIKGYYNNLKEYSNQQELIDSLEQYEDKLYTLPYYPNNTATEKVTARQIVREIVNLAQQGNADARTVLEKDLLLVCEEWIQEHPELESWQFAYPELKEVIKKCIYNYKGDTNFFSYLFANLKFKKRNLNILKTELVQNQVDKFSQGQTPKQNDIPKIEKKEVKKTTDKLLPRLKINIKENKNGGTDFNITGLKNYPVLTMEKERELAQKVKNGDEEAKNLFILSNLKLVLSIMKKYTKQLPNESVLTPQDLFQEGILGLQRAVEKFDWTKGYKFSTYATWWISEKIERLLNSYGRGDSVRLPDHMIELLHRFRRIKKEFEQKFHRPITTSEVAQNMDIEEETVNILTEIDSSHSLSLDNKINEEDENSLSLRDLLSDSEEIRPDEYTDKKIIKDTIQKAMKENKFSKKEIKILEMRYGLIDGIQHTLEKVGEEFGVTRERIRQIENKLLSILANDKNIKSLKEEIDQSLI